MFIQVEAETTMSFFVSVERYGVKCEGMLALDDGEWRFNGRWIGGRQIHWAEAVRRTLVRADSELRDKENGNT